MNLIIDLSPLAAALEEAGIKVNVFANAAVGRVSEQLAQRWRDSVKHAPGIRPDVFVADATSGAYGSTTFK